MIDVEIKELILKEIPSFPLLSWNAVAPQFQKLQIKRGTHDSVRFG